MMGGYEEYMLGPPHDVVLISRGPIEESKHIFWDQDSSKVLLVYYRRKL